MSAYLSNTSAFELRTDDVRDYGEPPTSRPAKGRYAPRVKLCNARHPMHRTVRCNEPAGHSVRSGYTLGADHFDSATLRSW